jgi:putative tricarboxylic transport membrane protein
MISSLTQAFHDVMTIQVMVYIFLGVLIGYLVGALPGMNRTTAIALLLPFTFQLAPIAAISFLIGISKGSAAGSAVSAILINVPGEPSSVVTTLDGYVMTRKGQSRKALQVALYASVIGDLLATFALIALAAPLASASSSLGSVELAAILIFSITFIAAVSGRSFFKALIAGLLGMMLAVPRLDIESGLPRMTFGFDELYDGVPLLAVAIGTLALSEILVQIDQGWRGLYLKAGNAAPADGQSTNLSAREFRAILPTLGRSSFVGVVIGILPGLGATLASFLSYTLEKRISSNPEKFGTGVIEGVAAPEAADNASVPASLIPMFGMGIPGSVSAALLMGAFMLHGLTPGPLLFQNDGALVYGIFMGMCIASLALLLVGLLGQHFFARVILVSDQILLPVIVFLCVPAAYMEGGGMFAVYLMLIFAVLGYFMKKFDFSFVTFLIGFILQPMFELYVRQAVIILDSNPLGLVRHPIAILFLAAAVFAVWRFARLQQLTTFEETAVRSGVPENQKSA